MTEATQKAVIGVKRMMVMVSAITAIAGVTYMARPATGEIPTSVVITAMTLIAAIAGVDVWKQTKGE